MNAQRETTVTTAMGTMKNDRLRIRPEIDSAFVLAFETSISSASIARRIEEKARTIPSTAAATPQRLIKSRGVITFLRWRKRKNGVRPLSCVYAKCIRGETFLRRRKNRV